MGISTRSNIKNIMSATVVARTLGITDIGLTGVKGGEFAMVEDLCAFKYEANMVLNNIFQFIIAGV